MRAPRLTRPALVAGLAALLLVGGGLAGGAVVADRTSAPAPIAVDVAGPAAGGDLAATASALQERLRRLPGDWQAWASLGAVYVQLAATTADPSYYGKAEQALERSLQERLDGNDAALTGQAALAASRHDFVAARELAAEAVAVNPYSSSGHGVLVDALVELGDYDQALTTLQTMVDLRPGVPSYTRASYLFELRGDTARARDALEQALGVAVDPGDVAFARRYLGELAWQTGDLEEAARQFEEGLRGAPGSAALLVGRARVAAARGQVEQAIGDYTTAVTQLPEPAYLAELGDLYASLGRRAEAESQYAVVRTVATLFRDAGADLDLEQALFAADHGDPVGALRAAAAVWSTQRSVHAADAYAWALHVNGRSAEALEIAAQAQRLGTRSALFDYHRGMIQLAVGDRSAAADSLRSALSLNEHFSTLHAPRARQALAGLEAGS